jgi:hypothetical protein
MSRPPLPHEHGAWVILYAPVAITIGALGPGGWLPTLLLLAAITGIFLGRHALGLLLRRRGEPATWFWLGIYLALTAAGALPLFWVYHRWDLLVIGALAAGLFAVHTLLLLLPTRKRLDRSQWGEILSVGALALTAPAEYIVMNGHLDGMAWCLWATCTLFFSSSVFFVKMLLAAVKVKGLFGWRQRWRVGRDNVLYHLLMTVVIVGVTLVHGGRGALLALCAFLPVLLRAGYGWICLSRVPPPLRRVGLGETVYALWFSIFFILSLRLGA